MTLTPPSSGSVTDTFLLAALGLLGQNYVREAAQAGTVTTSGTAYFMSLGLRAATVVSSVSAIVSSAASGPTLSKYGLYDANGNLLGSTADLGAAWASTGVKTGALAAAVNIPADGLYYVAILSIASVTQPTFLRDSAQALGAGVVGAGKRPYGNQNGLADLPNPFTIAGSAPVAYWVGVS